MIALLELLDRDGHVRQSLGVAAWPLRVGRAIDNDLVLDDPYTAAHHFVVDTDERGVYLRAGASVNGVRAGARRLAEGERAEVGAEPLVIRAGDTTLRLRLAEHALAPERPLRTASGWWHHHAGDVVLALLVLAATAAGVWVDLDPEQLARPLAGAVLSLAFGLMLWCGGWALVSKLFTRRLHFSWHLRVALVATLVSQAVMFAANLGAFAFSWPALSDYRFVAVYAVVATMLYFNLLGIEPRRPRRLALLAGALCVGALGYAMWNHQQARDEFGEELYMSHLFPPVLRVARPVDGASFVERLTPLREDLDERARDAGADDEDGGAGDEE